jgi:molybdopterin-guanine dinucleotide biosynthesis protein A
VIGLWPAGLRDDLADWLGSGRSKAVRDFLATRAYVVTDFGSPAADPFFNINTPADLERARAMLATS